MLTYNAAAAENVAPQADRASLAERLTQARDEAFADVDLWRSGSEIPAEKQPLDAGFIPLPADLLAEAENHGEASLLGRIEKTAVMLREELDRFLILGIGGSYMGARALFEALRHRYHNELPAGARTAADGGPVPKIYFEGHNLDNDTVTHLLQLLQNSSQGKSEDRWGLTVISKSGGTLETAVAFRVFRQALENQYGKESDSARKYVVPVTGEAGKLQQLSDTTGYPTVFPIPDGVGGRFSVFTAVGLLPAAVMGLNIRQLLQGAADVTELCRTADPESNPVLDYVGVSHLAEKNHGLVTRILSTWGSRLEAVGLWYDQLLAESLGKQEQGAFPLTVVNTRDLHSRGQQHQEGRRDKLITNVLVETPTESPLALPNDERNEDQLNVHAGKSYPQFLQAAFNGTNQAYADDARPTADILLPALDEYHVGALLQMLMLATTVEGRLIGINPYGQPGVEAYKKNMAAILNR